MYKVKGNITVNDKECPVTVVVENVSSVIEAVTKASDAGIHDVVFATLTKIKEIYHGKEELCEAPWFEAIVRDSVDVSDGKTKRCQYKILIQSESIDDAHDRANNIVSQGYDMTLVSVKKTDFYQVL